VTTFSISNVKTLTSISSHGWIDFRVKEPAPCVASAQIENSRRREKEESWAFLSWWRKEHPFRGDTTYRLIGGGTYSETGNRVAYEHNGSFYACRNLVTGNHVW